MTSLKSMLGVSCSISHLFNAIKFRFDLRRIDEPRKRLQDRITENCKMFDPESGLPPAKLQKNGSYFVEGDPKIFEIILNYLRYKVIAETPGVSMASVRMGAVYFGIQEMVNQIDVTLNSRRKMKMKRLKNRRKRDDEKIEEQKRKYANISKLVDLIKRYEIHSSHSKKPIMEVRGLERGIQLKIVHKSGDTRSYRQQIMDEAQEILKEYKITHYKVTEKENESFTYEMEFEM